MKPYYEKKWFRTLRLYLIGACVELTIIRTFPDSLLKSIVLIVFSAGVITYKFKIIDATDGGTSDDDGEKPSP